MNILIKKKYASWLLLLIAASITFQSNAEILKINKTTEGGLFLNRLNQVRESRSENELRSLEKNTDKASFENEAINPIKADFKNLGLIAKLLLKKREKIRQSKINKKTLPFTALNKKKLNKDEGKGKSLPRRESLPTVILDGDKSPYPIYGAQLHLPIKKNKELDEIDQIMAELDEEVEKALNEALKELMP